MKEGMIYWWVALIFSILPSLLTIIITVFVTNRQINATKKRDERHFAHQKELDKQKLEKEKEKDIYLRRRQNLSMIKGYRHQMTQLRVSYYGDSISFAYHNELNKRNRNRAFHIQEAHTWQHQALEVELEIAKNQYKLIETLGLIQSVSSENDEAMKLCEQINNFKWPRPPKPQSNEIDLAAWRENEFNTKQTYVENSYGDLLEKLSKILLSELLSH